MIPKAVIDKKRKGEKLTDEEIRFFINGFTEGTVSDAQMSALAMAICCRGMDVDETSSLTDVMMRSGEQLEWPFVTADKHSTGGVGDKLSLIIQPLVAACGISVPSLVGRGLGFTGGTADKLEAIPGYNAALSLDAFRKVVESVGVSMNVQTNEITPADRKLYALRDVTGTVSSVPLIVASILSKKLAEGAQTLVFDVKFGSGAFMETFDEAKMLAEALVSGAKKFGRKASAFITDMSSPLGLSVGNAVEVSEALMILRGDDAGGRLLSIKDLSLDIASEMIALSTGEAFDSAREKCAAHLADGSALKKFEAMVEAHGGSLGAFERELKKPLNRFKIQAVRSGYVSSIDALLTAKAAFALGAGRSNADDRIDPFAGVVFDAAVGDKVRFGEPIATLQASGSPDMLEEAAAILMKAVAISDECPSAKNLVAEKVV
jgi:pyrimidine-nucleoside phosphorylase